MTRQSSHTYFRQFGVGKLVAAEYGLVFIPKTWAFDGTQPAAIYCPALAGGAWNMMGWFMAYELVARGFLVVASDLGDTPTVPYGVGLNSSVGGTGTGGPGVWTKDSAMTKLTAVYDKVMAAGSAGGYGAAGPEVALMGGSHGGASSSRWAAENPSKIACLVQGIPAIDLQYIVDNNPLAGTRQSIQTALGMGVGLDTPSNREPITFAASYTKPVRCYHATNDQFTPLASYDAYKAANPSQIELVSLGAVGHTLTGMPWVTATDWIMEHIT